MLFGRCTLSVSPLNIDTYDGFRLSERIEARTVLSYVIDDFEKPFFRLANTYATTGAVLRCPETENAVIVSGVNVFREDVEALHGFYLPTLLWSSLVQSFSVQHALRETFGTDFLGEKSDQIGMPGCDEPSYWQPEDFTHNYDVDFVSPKGGRVEFSMDPIGISSYTIKYEGFLDRANNSLAPGDVDPGEYDAVFIGGGYGSLFDVASDRKLLSVIAMIYQGGGVVGGCGHGPGGFANVVLNNGDFMVAGKKVAGFPNSTEKTKAWAEHGNLLPFLVEDQLRKNGAEIINKENIADKNEVIIDQRKVSSMFLPSAAAVAKEMILLMESS